MYYLTVTSSINTGNKAANPGKKQNRFKNEFSSDVAEALGISDKSVFISSLTADSISFDIFATSQANAQVRARARYSIIRT